MAQAMKVAIVDDEQDMRQSISQWLALSGFETETFPSAEEALRNLGQEYPGVVVSDIKIILGTSGLFVSMPSKKRKNGTFRDIAHPLNNETRRRFEEQIIASYRDELEGSEEALSPLRDLTELEAQEESAPAPTPIAPPPGPSRGPDTSV